MDLVSAIHIQSWLDAAKQKAKELEQKVWLVRNAGGFQIVTLKPFSPTAEIWPGGRVVLYER